MALTRATGKQITVKNEGTGSVVRNLQDKLNETVSVKDFGAVGDGVTDDTAAIQAAIDTLRANPRTEPDQTELHIPHGTYKTTSTLDFTSVHHVLISGTGIIRGDFDGYLVSMTSSQWLRFSDISFEQINTGSSSGTVFIDDSYLISFENCYFYGGDKNINIDNGNNLIFDRCSVRYGRLNVYTGAAGNNTANIFRDSAIEKATEYNIYFDFVTNSYGNWLFDGCYIEGSYANGQVYIKNRFDVQFKSCYINSVGTAPTYLVALDGTTPYMATQFYDCRFKASTPGHYAFRQLSNDLKKAAVIGTSNTLESEVTAYNTSDTYIPKLITDTPKERNIYNFEWLLDTAGSLDGWTDGPSTAYTFGAPLGSRGEQSINITNTYVYKTVYLKKDVVYDIKVTAKNTGAGVARLQLFSAGLVTNLGTVDTSSTTPVELTFTYTPTADGAVEVLFRNTGTTNAEFSGGHIISYESAFHL